MIHSYLLFSTRFIGKNKFHPQTIIRQIICIVMARSAKSYKV